MNTLEVYAYVCYGFAGAPANQLGMHVTSTGPEKFPAAIDAIVWADQPHPVETWKKESYWALSTDGSAGYPPVLIHVYFEGDLPAERQRDEINHHAQRLAGKLLFNQD